MSERSVSLGSWEIVGCWLRPTREHLESFVASYSMETERSEVLTFRLPGEAMNSETQLTVHKSRLSAVQGPLQVLATGPFSESSTHQVSFDETRESFDIIRKFLYLQRIDMREVPPSFTLVADRWGLSVLFEACFHWAELSIFQPGARNDDKVQEFFFTYLPILAAIEVPSRFKNQFALRLAVGLNDLRDDDIASLLFPLVYETVNNSTEAPPSKKRKIAEPEGRTNSRVGVGVSTEDVSHVLSEETSANMGHTTSQSGVDDYDRKGAGAFAAPEGPVESVASDLQGIEVWEVFQMRGMLRHVIHYLAMYGNPIYLPDIVDVILHILEPRLADEELSHLLRLIPWYQTECRAILHSPCSQRWSIRAWRLLSTGLVESQQVEGRSATITIRFAAGCLWTDNSFATLRHEGEYFGHKVEAWISRGDVVGHLVLNFQITVAAGVVIPQITSPRICTIQDGCSCGFSSSDQDLRVSFTGGSPLRPISGSRTFVSSHTVMTERDIQRWKETHTSNCGMVVRILVWTP